MSFFSLIQSRRSVRLFKETPVEAEKLHRILEACNLAPSAGNLQGYEIYVVTDPEQRQALVRAALGQEFLAQAPVDLVFCANPQRSAVKYSQRGAGAVFCPRCHHCLHLCHARCPAARPGHCLGGRFPGRTRPPGCKSSCRPAACSDPAHRLCRRRPKTPPAAGSLTWYTVSILVGNTIGHLMFI